MQAFLFTEKAAGHFVATLPSIIVLANDTVRVYFFNRFYEYSNILPIQNRPLIRAAK